MKKSAQRDANVRAGCSKTEPKMFYLCANFRLPRHLCSRLRPDVRDRQTSDAHHRLNALYPRGGAKINRYCKKERYRSLLTPFNSNDNNDNDKRLGLTAKADQPDHKNTVH